MFSRQFLQCLYGLRYFVLSLILSNLVSCGGSSDSPKNQSANGYWKGEITDNFANTKDVFALFYEDEIMLADEFDKGIITGKVAINGSQFSSNKAKLFDDDGFNPRNIMIDGVIETRATIRATITDDIGEKHILSLNYERLSEEQISYTSLLGTWDYISYFGEIYSWNINEKGEFHGELGGCLFSGKFSIPNNSQNIIVSEHEVSGQESCLKGEYRGLALLIKDSLVAIASNDSYAEVGQLQKSDQ